MAAAGSESTSAANATPAANRLTPTSQTARGNALRDLESDDRIDSFRLRVTARPSNFPIAFRNQSPNKALTAASSSR
jgi:hypothetical protein